MADEEVDVRFGASLKGLQAGIEEAKERIEGLTGRKFPVLCSKHTCAGIWTARGK
jgi:hypothetical protein